MVKVTKREISSEERTHKSAESDEELGVVADAAMAAAERASDAIDDVLAFVAASNKRIAAMEANAVKDRKGE